VILAFKKFMFLSVIASVSILNLIGCTESEFQSEATPPDVVTPDGVDPINLSFDRDVRASANVDMVWVVDNSSSMAEEVQIIRENLGRFLTKLEERAKLNFTLISHDRGRFGVALSESSLAKGHKQIVERIESYNSITKVFELMPDMLNVSLKANSNKVFVFVTDDNSEVTSRSFFTKISKIFNLEQLKVFGFVGLSREASPCIDRVGQHYIDIAQATGGKTFNICETDWSPYFESLVKEVEKIAKTEYKLPKLPKSDLVVKVNGVEIKNFKIEGLSLIINPEVFSVNKKYKIEISFKP
jgi:hypothetical protein